jgi:hypothetical protein
MKTNELNKFIKQIGTQLLFKDKKIQCVFKKHFNLIIVIILTEAHAKIPKNPTFCTRLCTANLDFSINP